MTPDIALALSGHRIREGHRVVALRFLAVFITSTVSSDKAA
jgi:hypothetical protein